MEFNPTRVISLTDALLTFLKRAHPGVSEEDLMFQALYDALPEDQRAEIVDGRVVIQNCPAQPEQDHLQAFLSQKLRLFIRDAGLGGEIYGPNQIVRITGKLTGRQPDLFWVGAGDLPLLQGALFEGVPRLVVEILASETHNREQDTRTKAREYAELGIPEYWVLDPYGRETRFGRLEGGTYRWLDWTAGEYSSPLLPGLILRRSWVTPPSGVYPIAGEEERARAEAERAQAEEECARMASELQQERARIEALERALAARRNSEH